MTRISLLLLIVGAVGCGGSEPASRPVAGSAAGTVIAVRQVEPPAELSQAEVFAQRAAAIQDDFAKHVKPLLTKYCLRCHNPDEMKSGIRVDRLDGGLADRQLPLWKGIQGQLAKQAMPPEDEPQPTVQERRSLDEWIESALLLAKTRKRDKNGAVRRLTVAQYRNTLKDLLGLEDDLTEILPPDAVSKDGFLNNGQAMLLSPLLVEAYFEIAEKALDRCIVDENSRPVIQNFRMDFGAAINKKPCPDKLVLGALSRLLKNDDFVVTELTPQKRFDFQPFVMRTKYRFIEGYQGNATVRGWREYDSIYHAVFACTRGTDGYPKGQAHEVVPAGLMLRPAIPSAELFQVESTYGPKANFKISLRQLPDLGRFRVTVRAARVEDGLLLDPKTAVADESTGGRVTIGKPTDARTVDIEQPGIYQVDVYPQAVTGKPVVADATRLNEGLIGGWSLNGNLRRRPLDKQPAGQLTKGAKFVDSPFGQAVSFDGRSGSVVIPRDDSMTIGKGPFTIAAWIRPRQLRQAGIVCLGGYGYTQGFVFDMPGGNGVLRLETAKADNQHNGTVKSRPGVIRVNQWQHVAVIVRRGDKKSRLYVNGHEVGVGTIDSWDLDNPKVTLHIGRVQNGQLFAGEIDEVRFYKRALDITELNALVEPGRRFAKAPPTAKPQNLSLTLGERQFSGTLHSPAFLAVRLPVGPLAVSARYGSGASLDRIVLTPVNETQPTARRFVAFEKRAPRLGVHVGLRRDCGSTLAPVGPPRAVESSELTSFVFEGAISNFPSPDVEKDNVNYLAGVREIGVRSEYTDGRDMPRLLVRSVEFEGPLYDSWPPATHRKIFIESKHQGDPAAYARDVIRSFATRAFRRPIRDAELAPLTAVWQAAFDDTGDFLASIKDALLVVLTSPQFLFLIENSQGPQPEDLDAYELASKLSYFLWNTCPDQRLLTLAASDTLHRSIEAETERMIREPRFEQFVGEFTSQWLSLEKFDVVAVDRKQFPRLTRDTRTELRKEPAQLLQYLVRQNLPLRNLVQSDFIVANEVVAGYYGLADRTQSGFEFVPIRHESKNLGGVLTQAGILAGLSDGRQSNPVKRGAWLARKIIAEPPDDPPPNVPDLPDDDGKKLTLREKLVRHRDQQGCAKCHAGIDPWGLPFEQFDAGGLFQAGKDIDASSTLPDETEVADANALKAYLAVERIDQVAFSFLKHLATYATGRSLTYNENEFLREHGATLRDDGYRMQEMIRFVVTSELFLEK